MTDNVDIDVTANNTGTDEGDITLVRLLMMMSGTAATYTRCRWWCNFNWWKIGANNAIGTLDTNQDASDHHGTITLKGIGNTAAGAGATNIGNISTDQLTLPVHSSPVVIQLMSQKQVSL